MPDSKSTVEGHRVAVLAYEGLCLFEFSSAVEILSGRSDERGALCYQVVAASMDGPSVRCDRGISVTLEAGLDALEDAQTIIIPGWRDVPVPQRICDVLVDAHARGVRIASICTGAFVLAAAGLLDGRRATTHWRYAKAFADKYPNVVLDPDVLYVDEGDIITSAGSSAGIDMLLHLVRRDFGSATCNAIARNMVTPPHREGGQAQYIETPVPEQTQSAFVKVVDHLRRDPAADHRIEALAGMAAMSPRTFFRKFRATTGHTPYDWLLMERTRIAKEMLEQSDLSIDRIAERAGFGAADTFRHHFRRLAGTTPSQFRATFRQPSGEMRAAE